jgi:hypothetical protein
LNKRALPRESFGTVQANTAKAIDSLVQDLTTKREQRRKVMLEVESYLSSLEKQTSEVQKQTEEKLKSFMLNQSALESVCSSSGHDGFNCDTSASTSVCVRAILYFFACVFVRACVCMCVVRRERGGYETQLKLRSR